jgi:hypothetical protein
MSPYLPRFTAVLLFSAAALHAEDAVAFRTAAAVPPYELKKRSAFVEVSPNARAPFWPIGWVKRNAVVVAQPQAAAAPRAQLDASAFKVTSILVGSGTTPSLAVINGRAYSEGEFLRMPKGGTMPQARIRVQRINDGTVILQNADQTLVASLHRTEIQSKRTEELLLDPDR